jgi:hypothetical protein
VDVWCNNGGFAGSVSTGDESKQYACECIAAATLCHSGIAAAVEMYLSFGGADGSVCTFEYYEYVVFLCKGACLFHLPASTTVCPCQPRKLSGVRGKDAVRRQFFEAGGIASEDIERIGIEDKRNFRLFYHS